IAKIGAYLEHGPDAMPDAMPDAVKDVYAGKVRGQVRISGVNHSGSNGAAKAKSGAANAGGAAARPTAPALATLCEAWVQGAAVDWRSLYGEGPFPARIPLPAYPFAKQRYWYDE